MDSGVRLVHVGVLLVPTMASRSGELGVCCPGAYKACGSCRTPRGNCAPCTGPSCGSRSTTSGRWQWIWT
eukprot:4031463-Lingulodinium_polyedra.AAC.1